MWNGKGETTEYADKAGNKNMLMHDHRGWWPVWFHSL